LIKRRGRGNQDGGRFSCFAAGSPCSLPGAGNRPRIASQHGCVQSADIYAQFESVGRNNSQDFALTQAFFNFSPSGRQIAAAITSDQSFVFEAFFEFFLQVGDQNFSQQPTLGKDYRLQALFEKDGSQTPGFIDIRASDAK